MRLAALVFLLFYCFLFGKAQPPDFELIRKGLEEVDSLIFTNNQDQVYPLMRKLHKKQLSREAKLLLDVYHIRVEFHNRKLEGGREKLKSLKPLVDASDDSYVQGNWLLAKGIYHFRNRENELAIATLDSAESLLSETKLKRNAPLILSIHYKVLSYHWRLAQDQQALKEALWLEHYLGAFSQESVYEAEAYYCLGSIYQSINDIEKAKTYISQSIAISKAIGWNSEANNGYVVMGNIFYTAQQFELAIPFYEKAIQSEIELSGPDSYRLINYYQNCGFMYSEVGAYSKSIVMLYEGLDLAKRLTQPNSSEISKIYFVLADVHLELGNKDSARYYHTANLAIKKQLYVEKHEQLGYAYAGLASFFHELQMHDSSLFYIQEAIIASQVGFDSRDVAIEPELDPGEVSSPLLHLFFRKEKYLIAKWLNEKDPALEKMAIRLYEKLDEIIFRQRAAFRTDVSKRYLLDDWKGFFDMGLMLYSELLVNDSTNEIYLDKFFEILQKTKSILLLEKIITTEKRKGKVIPDQLAQADANTRVLLSRLDEIDSKLLLSDSVAELRFVLSTRLDSIEAEIEAQYPAYYSFKMEDNVATLDALRLKLESEESLFVEYYWGQESIFIFFFDGNSFTVKTISTHHDIQNDLDAVLGILETGSQDPFGYKEHAYALFQALMGDQLIDALKDAKSLKIVPHGPLVRLPFEALIISRDENEDGFDSFNYLIQSVVVGYHYSSFLFVRDEPSASSPKKVLALASYGADRNGANHLPGSKKELDGIRKYFDGKFIYDASKADLFQNIESSDIIHLAIHGKADTSNIYGSYLQFIKGSIADSRLFADELYSRHITSDLVVLSSCESGRGKVIGGEGTYSIGMAFKYGGAKAVIQSLWQADDAATQAIMTTFYEILDQGKDYSEALRTSKLKLLERSDSKAAHPHRWAAFTYYGPNSQPGLKLQMHYFIFAFGVASLLLILGVKRHMN